MLDPTRGYVVQIRVWPLGEHAETLDNKLEGSYRLHSVEVLGPAPVEPSKEPDVPTPPAKEVLVALTWEPFFLSQEQRDYTDTAYEDTDHIRHLDLDARTRNTLERAGITSIAALKARSEYDLRHIRNLGEKGRKEIRAKVK